MALSPQDQAIFDELVARQNSRAGGTQFTSQAPSASKPTAPTPPTIQGLMSADPALLQAGENAASSLSPRNSMSLMGMGASAPTPGGGGLIARKSPFESAADGVKTGMGMYNLLSTQKAKADMLRKMAGIGGMGNPMAGADPFGADPESPSAEAFPIDFSSSIRTA